MPAGVTEEKAALRRRLAALPPADWTPLCRRFLALPQLKQAGTVLLFWGVGREPDTGGMLEELLRRGKRLALPRCLPDRRMEAGEVTGPACLRPGAYGIPEPGADCPPIPREEIDLILVPNLCCDRRGFRLGHGGGYYDRYLAGYRGHTAALCPEEWLQQTLPTDDFDQPVELVLTQWGQWRGQPFL
ncbi:MAG: 5-formyltetrahydrofolate cyclo-ligase [Oscillospiraceae bacterium]|nr:5-formyltetrahydrofolate cyclo-ligase [Oscillospiraceae bacterium]